MSTSEKEAMGGREGNLDEMRVVELAISAEIINYGDCPVNDRITLGLSRPNHSPLRALQIGLLTPLTGHQKLVGATPGIHSHVACSLLLLHAKLQLLRIIYELWGKLNSTSPNAY